MNIQPLADLTRHILNIQNIYQNLNCSTEHKEPLSIMQQYMQKIEQKQQQYNMYTIATLLLLKNIFNAVIGVVIADNFRWAD